MFGQQKSVSWISKTLLSKASEEQIKKCFQETPIEFHYSEDLNDFKLLIEPFQKKILVTTITMKVMNKVYFFGDKKEFDKLVVMDDVSSLADNSSGFSGFLTVSKKFDYSCSYIFHILYPNKSNWQTKHRPKYSTFFLPLFN